MTTDFRALCAELADAYLRLLEYINNSTWLGYEPSDDPLLLRARAALADEPAVPDGREPAAITGQPSDQEGPSAEDVEELCEEHCFNVEGYESIECLQGLINDAIARWGNPAPQPPGEGEVEGLVTLLTIGTDCSGGARLSSNQCRRAAELLQQKPRLDYDRVQEIATEAQIRSAAQYLIKKQHCDGDLIPAIKYAIARWGKPAPQPVPVSERPWEREGWCDKRGMCWWLHVGEDGVGDWLQRAPYPSVTSYAFFRMTHCLPAHALPIPHQQENAND